jgi:hypothetical protein
MQNNYAASFFTAYTSLFHTQSFYFQGLGLYANCTGDNSALHTYMWKLNILCKRQKQWQWQ